MHDWASLAHVVRLMYLARATISGGVDAMCLKVLFYHRSIHLLDIIINTQPLRSLKVFNSIVNGDKFGLFVLQCICCHLLENHSMIEAMDQLVWLLNQYLQYRL